MARKGIELINIWHEIDYLRPVYCEDGSNCTEIGLTDGKELMDKRKVKSVLKELAGVFALDLGRLKRRYGSIVGRKSSCPIPLAKDYTLVPMKMRQPLGKDDGALGYVVKSRIVEVEGEANECLITLKSGQQILVYQKRPGLLNLFYDSDKVEDFYLQQIGQIREGGPRKNWIN
ncbi:hypothetical protein GGQ84_000612 [Desulfitispora alkaliphila]|uniref:hypothetical protein n=1 Tax=Desulfitispora alkaliphila TaxID=622674 RepID=UPI003D19A923